MIRFIIGLLLFAGSIENLYAPGLVLGSALLFWGLAKGRVFRE